MTTEELTLLRERIDHVNYALVLLLAERFRLTEQVGIHKKEHDLAIVDEAREEAQLVKIEGLAKELGMDAKIARKLFRLLIDEVRLRHESIRNN